MLWRRAVKISHRRRRRWMGIRMRDTEKERKQAEMGSIVEQRDGSTIGETGIVFDEIMKPYWIAFEGECLLDMSKVHPGPIQVGQWMDSRCVATTLPSVKADGLSPASAPLLSTTPTTDGRMDPTHPPTRQTHPPSWHPVYRFHIYCTRLIRYQLASASLPFVSCFVIRLQLWTSRFIQAFAISTAVLRLH